jgi:hypothetical protein
MRCHCITLFTGNLRDSLQVRQLSHAVFFITTWGWGGKKGVFIFYFYQYHQNSSAFPGFLIKQIPLFLVPVFFTFPIYQCLCQESRQKPQGNEIILLNPNEIALYSPKETPASDYIRVYQKYISGIRGQECPMHPSCSNFGLKTFRETNFI